MTWKPWKPVAMKKVEPYMLPLKANGACAYSYAWTLVNSRPSRIVHQRPILRPCLSPWISEWCAQVTVVPEHSRIMVLRSGKPHGLRTSMPLGGHCPPTASTADGNSEESKKAQNQARKNITSEAMNRIIP